MEKKASGIFTGLSNKIRLSFGILFLLTFTFLGIFIYTGTESQYKDFQKKKLMNFTVLISHTMDLYIKNTVKQYLLGINQKTAALAAYFHSLSLKGELSKEEAMDAFKKIVKDAGFGAIGRDGYIEAYNSKGVAVIHPGGLEGKDLSGREPVQQGLKIKRSGYIEKYMWQTPEDKIPLEKSAAVTYFEPWDLYFWASSKKTNYLALLDLDEMKKIINRITVGEKGYLFLMDKKGNLLSHPEIPVPVNIFDYTDANNRSYIQIMCERKTSEDAGIPGGADENLSEEEKALSRAGDFIFYPGERAEDKTPDARLAYYLHYDEMEWIVAASVSKEEIYQAINALRNTSLVFVLMSFILTNVILGIFISLLLKPVSKIRKIAGLVSQGDLRKRIPVRSQDEIGEMSEQFNHLIDDFAAVLNSVKSSSTMLLQSVQGLTVSAQQIAATSNEQAASVKEIVSTMEDSDSLAKSVADKINDVTHIAGRMKDTVTGGFSIIQKSLTKMEEIKKSNADTIVGVQSLSDKIGSIWEIVNIINNIADQTKIIAFNAELEASAAGDAGKNFQIVATEIRRLADNTVSSTNEIKARINEIQNSSDNLIISSEDGTTKIREGWESSNELQKVFEDILSSSEISATSADQIALSINQQVSAFEQILLTLRQISEGIDSFVTSTESTTNESKNLKKMADSLDSAVSKYLTDAGDE